VVGAKFFLPVGARGYEKRARHNVSMTFGLVTCRDRAKSNGDDGAIEQANDATQWADPRELTALPPAHGFRPREFCQRVRQDICQNGRCRRRWNLTTKEIITIGQDDVFAFGRVFSEETGQGRFRCRISRPSCLENAARRLRRDCRFDGNPARPVENFLICIIKRAKAFCAEVTKRYGAMHLHPRRNLLGKQFQKKLRHCFRP